MCMYVYLCMSIGSWRNIKYRCVGATAHAVSIIANMFVCVRRETGVEENRTERVKSKSDRSTGDY